MHLESITVANKERFVFRQTYEEFQRNPVAKTAGFTFNYNGEGRDNRYWFTDDITIAARLRNFASGELRLRLDAIEAKPKNKLTLSFDEKTGRYIFLSEKEHKDIPKEAGFFWSQDDKVWWTFEPDRAAKLAQYADDTCRAALMEAIAEMERAREASRAMDADIDVPVPANQKLRGYQKVGVQGAVRQFEKVRKNGKPPGFLLADDMGIGKTCQSICTINYLARASSVARVLIVVPATIKINWLRELATWLIDYHSRKILVADSRTSQWKFEAADCVIINYDILMKHLEWHKEKGKGKKENIIVDSLGALNQEWDFLICDEVQRIKNPQTQKAQAIFALTRAAKRVMYLTGTPMENRVAELFTLLHALDPEVWHSFWQYTNTYGGNGSFASNKARYSQLQDKLRASGLMVRRLKSQVLAELPPKQWQVVELEPDDLATVNLIKREQAEWQKHQSAIEDLKIKVELAKASDDPEDYKRAVKRLREGVNVSFEEMSRIRHETALAKVPYTIRFIKELIDENPYYKVIVGAWHNDVIETLAASFEGRCVTLTGSVSANTKTIDGQRTSERMLRVDKFQTDPDCQIFFGNLRAAGVGLNLVASSHVLLHEQDWNPAVMNQFVDRAHRIGQEADRVLIQCLVLQGSLDVNMAHTLVEKQTIINQVLDSDYIAVDSIASGLAKDKIEMPDEDPIVPFTASEESASKSISKERIAKEAQAITDEQIKAVHLGLRMLSGMCDGAMALDGAGFNRMDSAIGKSIAAQSTLSAKQAVIGQKLCIRYGRQLPAELLASIKGESCEQKK